MALGGGGSREKAHCGERKTEMIVLFIKMWNKTNAFELLVMDFNLLKGYLTTNLIISDLNQFSKRIKTCLSSFSLVFRLQMHE